MIIVSPILNDSKRQTVSLETQWVRREQQYHGYKNESGWQKFQVNLMNLRYKCIIVNSDSNTSMVSLTLKESRFTIVSDYK